MRVPHRDLRRPQGHASSGGVVEPLAFPEAKAAGRSFLTNVAFEADPRLRLRNLGQAFAAFAAALLDPALLVDLTLIEMSLNLRR